MASVEDPKSVIVIGAGVAGLTAASKLKKQEFDVILLEAGTRIGGRVHSYKLGKDWVEIGAQWIHGEKGNNIFALAQPFGLIEEENRSYRKFGPSAMYVTQSGEFLYDGIYHKVKAVIEKLDLEVGNGVQPEMSLGQYASRVFWELNGVNPVHEKRAVCQGVLDWIHRFKNSIDGSDNWFQPSCQGQVEYKACEGNMTIPWKSPAAYASLFDLILYGEPRKTGTPETIPDWIHLNKEVTEVKYSFTGNGKVTVTCRDGSKYTVDQVICTVSLGVLKSRHTELFNPVLPEKKVAAIENLGFGSVDKIYITFETAWWPESFIGFNLIWEDTEAVQQNWLDKPSAEILASQKDGIPIWCRSLLGFNPVNNTTHTLVSWITGPPARFMETMSPSDLKRDLAKVLNIFLGKTYRISEIIEAFSSKWHTNQYICGSYSFRTVESEKYGVSAADLAEPIKDHRGKPVICFAGEATHSHYFSTVHGAYDTGVREAERLTEYYRKLHHN